MTSLEPVVPKNVSSVIPWTQVCKMFDKVQTATREGKKEMLLKFIQQYRDLLKKNASYSTDSFFPVLRVLLPALDRDRGAYGIKERKLAELYIRILGLKKGSVDAQKLINYRKPKSGSTGPGDFAEIAFYVLKNRCPEKGDLSLYDVDKYLTIISESHASKDQETVDKSLLQMLRKMPANEQKWLIRVLLKDMHLGIGQTTIFSAWHPDAKDYYDVNNSLAKVCSTLRDPSVRLHEIEVSLFSPFRPMLAERVVLEKVEAQMKHQTFYVEIKYDGERSQIHKKGSQYKYFSRNGFDFSSNFGTSPLNGLFTPYLHPLFSSHVQEAILDGEMVGWSQKYKTIVSKGDHLDVKNLKEDRDWIVCFCAFDLLYLNGKVLTNLPLKQRVEELSRVLSPLDGRVIISTHSEVTSREDVVNILNKAIDDREEGVVLKDPNSAYQPNARRSGWIKVKPDYIDTCVPELDLLIVGGYYGSGRRRGVLSHFLLAVAETNPEKNSRPKALHAVTRVASGYTMSELEDLIARLSKYSSQKQPSNVLVGREKPDVWIVPEKSCVLQVKAAEIVKSGMYKTGVTLRFPRVEKIRSDKSWFEILTTEELIEISRESSGKLANKHYILGDKSESPKKKVARPTHQPSLPEFFRPADVSNVVKKADLFAGKEFCIIDGGEGLSKHNLETLVVEHGASFSQHPGKSTYCIICDKSTVRVQNLIKSGLYNVVKPAWLLDSISAGRILTWSPLHFFHLLPENLKKSTEEYDEFGDSFYAPTTPDQLKCVMENMTNQVEGQEVSLSDENDLDILINKLGEPGLYFRGVKAYFPHEGELASSSTHILQLKLRLHGGEVSPSLADDTTHIIVPQERLVDIRASEYPRKRIAPTGWIEECMKVGKLVSERILR